MYSLIQEICTIFETLLGSETLTFAFFGFPLLLPLTMRLYNSLIYGGIKKKSKIKKNIDGDWEKQLEILLHEHNESCRNVKNLLEEKKR